jgi:hypothetical protein
MPLRKKTGTPIPAAAPETAAPPAVALPVPFIKQEQTQWCWAAGVQMIGRCVGVDDTRQCELANFLHNQTNCCQKPRSARCNQPCPYVSLVPVANRAGMNGIGPDHPLSFNTLGRELAEGRPVGAGLNWNAGGGHFIVIYGYTDRGRLFLIRDPWNGSGAVTYQYLSAAYGMGRWYCAYGRFTKRS